jgi:hypothetical protein
MTYAYNHKRRFDTSILKESVVSLAVKITIFFCVALLAALIAAIVWAAGRESLGDGFRRLLDHPWGVVTLIDVYAGFFFVGAWLWTVERHKATLVIWLLLLFCTGNAATLLYLTLRARKARRFADLFRPALPETA